jgi:hypothetical protein
LFQKDFRYLAHGVRYDAELKFSMQALQNFSRVCFLRLGEAFAINCPNFLYVATFCLIPKLIKTFE